MCLILMQILEFFGYYHLSPCLYGNYQGKNVNLLSEVKLALMRTLVVGSIQHNVQETLTKTGKRITGDFRDNLALYFHSTHAFVSVSRIFPRKSHVIS